MNNFKNNFKTCLKTFLVVSFLSASINAYADDTELFINANAKLKPNLLFVLDLSRSMRKEIDINTPGTLTRSISSATGDYTHQKFDTAITDGQEYIDLSSGTIARFRFENIDIPQGSIIDDAYIQFTATADEPNFTGLFFSIEDEGDAPELGTIDEVDVFAPALGWVASYWLEGETTTKQKTETIKDEVQRIISSEQWNSGNAMAFYVENTFGPPKQIATFENPIYDPPKLVINYTRGKITRIDAMKESLTKVLEVAPDNINIGVMNFALIPESPLKNPYPYRHHSVGGVAFPVTDINAKVREVIPTAADAYNLPYPDANITVREYISDLINTWQTGGVTPIVDALYEAALYYRGERMHFGQTRPDLNGAHPSTYTGAEITMRVDDLSGPGRDAANAPKYNSPIVAQCQANNIVLLGDGAPWNLYPKGGRRKGGGPSQLALPREETGMVGELADAITNCGPNAPNSKGQRVNNSGWCGAELTNYIATTDNIPDSKIEDKQTINTYTIGFGIDDDSYTEAYFKSLTTVEGGYFNAQTPEELAAAFTSIIDKVSAPSGSLASPGYSVSAKSGLAHENDIYIPAFERGEGSRWSGNLKKFSLLDTGTNRVIVGKDDVLATDEQGRFTSEAIDLWSEATSELPDGSDVSAGGVASLLDPDSRNIFSNLSGSKDESLNKANNLVHLNNINNLTNDVLGLASDSNLSYRQKIVSFMRGWEDGIHDASAVPERKKRHHMGDMLHSDPLVITYNAGTEEDLSDKEQYVFIGTNEGYLHAFDAKTGEEKFAFIPKDLLGSISESQFLNAGTADDHKYGIDSTIIGDFSGGSDGKLDSGDQVILYFGLRRGGTAYYALDVTNIDNPILLWKKSAADHPSMGQSWSVPYIAKIADKNNKTREVVIVSAGYDEDEDRDIPGSQKVNDSTSTVVADVGNDIFIFDAKTGEKLWSMPTEMRSRISNSIPGGIKPLDTNNNNLIDRIYFGDTGGNVWRLDLDENNGTTTGPDNLTKLASIGGTGSDNRMFYNEPDVALMSLNGKSVYAISIGSGFRAHPLDTEIEDKFYVFVDDSPFSPLKKHTEETFDTITESDLATITVSSSGNITNNGLISDEDKRGFLINFPGNGEKVLGNAKAIKGSIIFPTFVINDAATEDNYCGVAENYSRIYAIDILTSSAKFDLKKEDDVADNNDENPPTPSAFTDPLLPEIINGITEIFNTPKTDDPVLDEDGNPTGDTECSHTVDFRVGKKSSQIAGYNACKLDTIYWSDPLNIN